MPPPLESCGKRIVTISSQFIIFQKQSHPPSSSARKCDHPAPFSPSNHWNSALAHHKSHARRSDAQQTSSSGRTHLRTACRTSRAGVNGTHGSPKVAASVTLPQRFPAGAPERTPGAGVLPGKTRSMLGKYPDRIVAKSPVGCKNRTLRMKGQRNRHPVKGVLVMRGQQLCRMAGFRRKGLHDDLVTKTNLAYEIENLRLTAGQLKFPHPEFPRDFPYRDTQDNGVPGSGQFAPRHPVRPSPGGQVEKRTSVEHMGDHFSSFHSDSQMSSSLKAMRCFQRGSGSSVLFTGSSTRTIRNFVPPPPRRISTSSPFSALRKGNERLFLALRTVVSILGHLSQIPPGQGREHGQMPENLFQISSCRAAATRAGFST